MSLVRSRQKAGYPTAPIPFSEARSKYPDFEKAVCFVERLYNRPAPKVAEKSTVLFEQPSFFVAGEYRQHYNSGTKVLERSLTLQPGNYSVYVHELAHLFYHAFKDEALHSGMSQEAYSARYSTPRQDAVIDGTARFAQDLSTSIEKSKRPRKSYSLFAWAAVQLAVVAGGIYAAGYYFVNSTFERPAAELIFRAQVFFTLLANVFVVRSAAREWSKYRLVHNCLCTLSKKLGDPFEAFRLVLEKPPTALRDLWFPSRFYHSEIEARKSNGLISEPAAACVSQQTGE